MTSAPRNRLTSTDLARAAGVSQSTVSLVMSGKAEGRISPATQARVREVAERLGYVPNQSARMLRGVDSQVIALAVPDVRHEYFGHVLTAAERAAREAGLAVLLVDTYADEGWVDRLVALGRAQLLAGAIVYAESGESTLPLRAGVEHLVVVEPGTRTGLPAIELDIASGLEQVVGHLWSLGHRRIAHAGADPVRPTFALRGQHLRSAIAARGGSHDPREAYRSGFGPEESTVAAETFLLGSRATAVFCDDDLLAAGVYRAARRLGVRIPEDLSVVGFNDVDLARYLEPELTTVAIPADRVGAEAVARLLAATRGTSARSLQTLLPLSLQVRGSTARPRRRTAVRPAGSGSTSPAR